MLIGMIRFAVHLIYMATNPSIRAHYQSLGVTISAAVAAISLGTVMIPPEAVAWVLMSAASIINGGKEAAQLCKGAEIALWPGKSARNIPMRYRDYVRLFIVMQSPDAIAKRLSHVVFQARVRASIIRRHVQPCFGKKYPMNMFPVTSGERRQRSHHET